MAVRLRPRKLATQPRGRALVNALPAVTPPPLPPAAKSSSPSHSRVMANFASPSPAADEMDPQSFSQSWLRRHTSFAISMLVHLLLLIGLAVWTIAELPKPTQIALTSVSPPLPEIDESIEILSPADLKVDEAEISSALGGDLTDFAAVDAVEIDEVNAPFDQTAGTDVAVDILSVDQLMQSIGGGASGGGQGGIGPGLNAGNMMQFVERLQRAGAKGGDVQISLIWDNLNDLDLHVTTPRGETIFFGKRNSRCRGELDVDMNAGHGMTREPVENIYWGQGKAPLGKFKIYVHEYRNHGDPDPTEFELRVIVDGTTKVIHGETGFGNRRQMVYEFERTKLNRGPASGGAVSPSDEFPLLDARR